MAAGRSAQCLAGGRDVLPHEKWRMYDAVCVPCLLYNRKRREGKLVSPCTP